MGLASKMSLSIILPPIPVPCILLRSIPFSFATFLALGLTNILFEPSWTTGAGYSAGVAAAYGAAGVYGAAAFGASLAGSGAYY